MRSMIEGVVVGVMLSCLGFWYWNEHMREEEPVKAEKEWNMELWTKAYTAGISSGSKCSLEATQMLVEGGMSTSAQNRATRSVQPCLAAEMLEALAEADIPDEGK